MASIELPQGADLTTFPHNVSVTLARAIATDMDELSIVAIRELEMRDPNRSVGISVVSWAPIDYEIGNGWGPARSAYRYRLSLLVRGAPEALALAESAALTKKLRVMLYRSDGVMGTLQSLESSTFGVREACRRLVVEGQEFRSDRAADNDFIVLTATTIRVELENY